MSTSNASAKAEQGFFKRVPKGIPTGGQFAENAHPEANVVLGSRGGDDGLSQYTDPETLLKMAQTSAAYWQNHYGQKGKSVTVDVDDLCQETISRVLKNVRSGKPITDFRQLVNSIAANVTVRSTRTVFRAEDRKAYRDFEARRTAEEHRLNRSLTQHEEDVIAESRSSRSGPTRGTSLPWNSASRQPSTLHR